MGSGLEEFSLVGLSHAMDLTNSLLLESLFALDQLDYVLFQ